MVPAALMGILVYIIGKLLGSSLPVLVLQVIAGAVIYVIETRFFMPEVWNFVMNGVKTKLGRKAGA
jgi:hypothetical protein